MKKKLFKATLLVLCAVALVVGSVLATIAYLTSYATVSNTFTVGNVGIQMYESKVNDNGEALVNDPNIHGSMKDAQGNTYHLVPGKTYAKDPTVYINPGSDASYVFVYVQNGLRDVELGHFVHDDNQTDVLADAKTIEEQMAANGWAEFQTGSHGVVYVFAGKRNENTGAMEIVKDESNKPVAQIIPRTESILALDVFSTFTIDQHAEDILNNYATAEVNLTAYAIQSAGFEGNVNAAWAAILEAYPRQAPVTNN